MDINFNREKFKAVVHYICHACKNNPETLGKTKLHKILYFSDMLHYVETFEPLTGVEYQKQPFGPTAKHLGWALKELEASKILSVEKENFFGLTKYSFESHKSPKSNLLSAHEQDLLDAVIDFVCGMTANEISDLSHQAPWENVKLGDIISYESAFLLIPPNEITQELKDWAFEEVERLGL